MKRATQRSALAGRGRAGCPLKLSVVAFAAVCAGAVPVAAQAQGVWITQGGLQLTLNATDNGNEAPSGEARNDLVTTLRPQIRIARRGANFGLSADLSADLVNYANNSQSDRVLPAARVDLDATAIDRLLYLDASVDVRSAESDPFRGSSEVTPDASTDITSTYRVSPYLDYEISPRVNLVARADESLTTSTQESTSDLRAHRAFVRLNQKPLPLGASVELSRQALVYSDRTDGELTTEAVRGSVSYAFAGQFLVSGIAGHERNDLDGTRQSDPVYGAQFQWLPGPRTDMRATVEKRFFGTGWNLGFRHRTPFVSLVAGMSREPVGYTAGVGGSSLDSDLSQYVDAILTTRFPDPVERQAQVDQLVSQRGLRTQLPDAVTTLADYPQLRTKSNAALVWLSPRSSVALSAYTQTLKRLTRSGDTASPAGADLDTRQHGAALELNRRLSPQTSLDAIVQWSRVKGMGAREGDESRERSYRVSVSRNLSPRTNVAVGVQYRKLDTTVQALASYAQTSGFLVMNYRF